MTKYLMNYQSMYTRSGSYIFVILSLAKKKKEKKRASKDEHHAIVLNKL
jgi:hypothetical protein